MFLIDLYRSSLNLVQLRFQTVKSKRKAREGLAAKAENIHLQGEIARLEKSHEELRTHYESAWNQELEALTLAMNNDMDARLSAVKSIYEIKAARAAAENEASEKQLADHVLQNEVELERLQGERDALVRIFFESDYSLLIALHQNEQIATFREQMQNTSVRSVVLGCPILC